MLSSLLMLLPQSFLDLSAPQSYKSCFFYGIMSDFGLNHTQYFLFAETRLKTVERMQFYFRFSFWSNIVQVGGN
jgi:hypothetical protein